MCVCVPFFLPSLYLAACQIYEVPVCRNTSPSRLPVSHFRLSYFARVAACNLKTSSPGSSSFSLHPTQCSREHHHYTCLSLIKKSGPLCTANPSRQTDSAATHTDRGIWKRAAWPMRRALSASLSPSPSLSFTLMFLFSWGGGMACWSHRLSRNQCCLKSLLPGVLYVRELDPEPIHALLLLTGCGCLKWHIFHISSLMVRKVFWTILIFLAVN